MPTLNLGQAISGRYSTNFDNDSIFKGMQMGGQKVQREYLKQQQEENRKAKEDAQNLKLIENSIDLQGIDQLDMGMAKQEATNITKQMYDEYTSGNPNARIKIGQLKNDLKAKLDGYRARKQGWQDVVKAYHEGRLPKEQAEILKAAYDAGGIDKVAGKFDRLFGAQVGETLFPQFTILPKESWGKVADDALKAAKLDQQELEYVTKGGERVTYKGMPRTRKEAMETTAAQAGLQVVSAEDFAEDLWNSPTQRMQFFNSISDELKNKFGEDKEVYFNDEEVQDYAKQRFISEIQNRYGTTVSRKNVPKPSSDGGGSKARIFKTDFQPETLNFQQVGKAIYDAKGIDLDKNKALAKKLENENFSAVRMPQVEAKLSYTDEKGRVFNTSVNDIVDVADGLFVLGQSGNLPVEGYGVPINLKNTGAFKVTPSSWGALKTYYAAKGLEETELLDYINSGLAESNAKHRIRKGGEVYKIGIQTAPIKGATKPTFKNVPSGGFN